MKNLIFLLLFCSSIFAQDCKFKINEIDAFSKEKRIKTEYFPITTKIATTIYFSFYNYKESYIDLKLVTGGAKSLVVNNNLEILLNNDEVLQFPSIAIHNSDLSSIGEFTNTVLFARYSITASQLEKIKTIGVKKIRVNFMDSHYDADVKKKNWIDVMNKNIECFIHELQ